MHTVTISGTIDGLAHGEVRFILSAPGVDDEQVIQPQPLVARCDGAGGFQIDLWPNDRGALPTSYSVEVQPLGAEKWATMAPAVYVSDTAMPQTLSDLMAASALAGLLGEPAVWPKTAAEFEALNADSRFKLGLYLVAPADEEPAPDDGQAPDEA